MRDLQGKPCPPDGEELELDLDKELGRWRHLSNRARCWWANGRFWNCRGMPEWLGLWLKLQKHRAVQEWVCYIESNEHRLTLEHWGVECGGSCCSLREMITCTPAPSCPNWEYLKNKIQESGRSRRTDTSPHPLVKGAEAPHWSPEIPPYPSRLPQIKH